MLSITLAMAPSMLSVAVLAGDVIPEETAAVITASDDDGHTASVEQTPSIPARPERKEISQCWTVKDLICGPTVMIKP